MIVLILGHRPAGYSKSIYIRIASTWMVHQIQTRFPGLRQVGWDLKEGKEQGTFQVFQVNRTVSAKDLGGNWAWRAGAGRGWSERDEWRGRGQEGGGVQIVQHLGAVTDFGFYGEWNWSALEFCEQNSNRICLTFMETLLSPSTQLWPGIYFLRPSVWFVCLCLKWL